MILEGKVLHILLVNYAGYVTQKGLSQNILATQELGFIPMSDIPAEVIIRHYQVLRATGIDDKYKIVIIDAHQQERVVYVDKDVRDKIGDLQSLECLRESHQSRYIRVVAHEVAPDIWLAQGQVEIMTISEEPPFCVGHLTRSPQTLYPQQFLAALRTALDEMRTGSLTQLIPENESPDSFNIFITPTFSYDLQNIPSAPQDEALHLAQRMMRHKAPISEYGGDWLHGFYRILYVPITQTHYMTCTSGCCMAEHSHLYLLRFAYARMEYGILW
jgi:hypothetical protein